MAPHDSTASFFDPEHQGTLWKFLHVFNFALGGTTFIAGTSCLFFPEWELAGNVSAILYIIGSVGFLGVCLCLLSAQL